MKGTKTIADPQAPHDLMEVCANCGWPPALESGLCVCETHPDWDDFDDYPERILELRARVGLSAPDELN